MNGWVIVAVVLALLIAAMRLWFHWFSRRPLTSTDDYAVAVDAAVDDAAGPRAGPAPLPAPKDQPNPLVTATAGNSEPTSASAEPALPGPRSGVVQRVIPRQRTASDLTAPADARAVDRPLQQGH